MSDFSNRLKQIMRSRKISQSKICKATGIAQSTVSSYVCGVREPSVGNLILIADYLDESIDFLLGRDVLPE